MACRDCRKLRKLTKDLDRRVDTMSAAAAFALILAYWAWLRTYKEPGGKED